MKLLSRLLVFIYIFPIIWLVLYSQMFKFDFQYYFKLLSNSNLILSIYNSMIFGGIQFLLIVIIVPPIVYYCTYLDLKMKKLILNFTLTAYFISSIFICIAFMWIFNSIEISNPKIRIVLSHFTITFPFSTWLLLNFTHLIESNLLKITKIYKTSDSYFYYKIFLPLMKLPIIAVGIFAFILSWNDFIFSKIFIHSSEDQNFPLWLTDLTREHFSWQESLTAGVLSLLPVIIFSIIMSIVYGNIKRRKSFIWI